MSHFVYVLFSWFLFICLSILIVHWTYDHYFKFFLSGNLCIFISLGSSTEIYFGPLVVSCFLDSLCSLMPCIAVFTFEEVAISSSVYQLALGEKEVRHQSAQLEFWGFHRPFLWVCILHSSYSLMVGKFRIVCFLSVLQSQYECGKPPIYFP